MTTPADVAAFMRRRLDEGGGILYQEQVVCEIEEKFSKEFVYTNDNGNLAIERAVLKEFRKLTEHEAIWEDGEKMWRWWEPGDPPGRRAAR